MEEDNELIQRQLELYNADITICCGSIVTDVLRRVVWGDKKEKWQQTKRGVPFLDRRCNRGGIIINYAHPEARVEDYLLYYGLVDAVREIRDLDTRT